MKLKKIIYVAFFFIFAISCKESVFEPETVKSTTPELKSATISKNYYVSKTGSDSNAGTLSAPFLTIQKAANIAVAGDTVTIREGIYQAYVNFFISGKSTSPITVMPYQSEKPIIDGNNYTIPSSDYYPILNISGNYINLSGIEVRYSRQIGIQITGQNCIISNVTSHHNKENGIIVQGNYSIVQNSLIYSNALTNENGVLSVSWAAGLSAARHPIGCILRNNVSHDNWGEGISTFEADGTIIEGNTVYDNFSGNIYVSDAINIIVRKNFIYRTKDMTNGSMVGILLGDEVMNPASSNLTITNNIVYGCRRNLYWWGSNGTNGMKAVFIANNTFVNSIYEANVVFNEGGPHSGVIFENNIITQNASLKPIKIVTNSGIQFSNNLWSSTPNSLASGLNDIIGDVKLKNISNPYVAASYALTSSSPCINAGVNIGLTTDFSQNVIAGLPDIGAYEYTGSNSTTIYYNTQTSASATKNSCGTGYTGSTVAYTVPANKYNSTVSQVDADNKALADLNNNKQAYANANGTCTAIPVKVFYNTQVSATATKNSCGTGYTGSTVTYTILPNKYSSTVSQSDADNKALADLTSNKQSYANTNGTCTAIPVTVYYNTKISTTATKNSCGKGYIGSRVTYTVSAGKYTSTISQADANAKASSDLYTNAQSYANLNGTCTRIKWWRF